jgi:hypothetical protein
MAERDVRQRQLADRPGRLADRRLRPVGRLGHLAAGLGATAVQLTAPQVGAVVRERAVVRHIGVDPVECNHMGILEHSFLVESRGLVAGCDN